MWYLTLVLSLIGFSFTLLSSIYLRYSTGASTSELIRSRFYEIVPLRVLFWVFMGIAVECSVLFLSILIIDAYSLSNQDLLFTSSSLILLQYLIFALVPGYSGWLLWKYIIMPAKQIAPEVDIKGVRVRSHIDPHHLSTLGAERFPNHIDPNGGIDDVIRWIIVVGSALTIGLLLYAGFGGLIPITDEILKWENFQDLAVFLLWVSFVLLVLIILNNHDYTFLPFRRSLIYQAILSITGIVSLFIITSDGIYLAWGIGVSLCFCGGRGLTDLWRSRKYRKIKQVTDPIADDLKRLTPYLDRVSRHPDFKLPELDFATLSERITRGCVNVEERGLFVLRSFARYMRIVEVEKQAFSVAMLRYLTVNRGVTLASGTGTHESIRHPEVPVWNLQLFPLHPPRPSDDDGFRNMDDQLTLNHEWDVIQTCRQCNGSGWVTETETYYETEHYTESYTDSSGQSQSRSASRQVSRTRTVQRICPSCSGSGRTRHSQLLNTWWRYLIPRVTDPEIPIPELVENAEEVRYFRLPLTTEFEPVPFDRATYSIDDPLVNQMIETGRKLGDQHAKHTESILSLSGGRLYQADFQICGFHTIHILSKALGGRSGWFFGKRPEFYFPRLPLSYSTIGTLVFLPPLVITIAILILYLILTVFLK
jgi:hypothetical protein